MLVKYYKSYPMRTTVIKSYEKISSDLLLFNIMFQLDEFQYDSRPIHKRYEFGDFPPFDVSFDSQTGLLKEITLFIRKGIVNNSDNCNSCNLINKEGFPCFKFENIVKNEFYYDENVDVNINIVNDVLVVQINKGEQSYEINIDKHLKILLNNEEEFLGFKYFCLESEMLEMLK